MHAAARRLAILLAGFGLAGTALAEPERSDSSPYNRRYETTRSDGARKTVIDLQPAGDGSPAPSTMPVAPALTTPLDGPGVPDACPWRPTFWAEAEYLQWWYRAGSIPPLVTAGSPLDPIPGALAEPGTRVLFGNGPGTAEWTSGARARIGGWFPDTPIGWEVGAFYTVPQEKWAGFSSKDLPVLSRPFFDSFLVTPSSLLFGAADAFDGAVTVHTRTTFWGFEVNGTAAMDQDGCNTAFVGYRHLVMTDDLDVTGVYTLGPGGLAFASGVSLLPGAVGRIEDSVHVHNQFDGAQLGWKFHGGYGRFGLDVRAAVAVGVGSQQVKLNGSTQTVDADGTVRTAPAGVLVQPSNFGQYSRDRLTAVPEVGARLSFRLSPGVSLYAGYDFLYWASVARAGDQLDHVVDTRQAPFSGNFTGGPGFRPISPLRDTAFWAQGFNFGVRFEY